MTDVLTETMVLDLLEKSQRENGAFPSKVCFYDKCYDDSNAFITALVLRHSWNLQLPDVLPEVFQRAVSYLKRCRSSRYPGMYFFWPEEEHPFWMGGQRLREDADDSSIISMLLVRHQLEGNEFLTNLARNVLEQHRYFSSQPLPGAWQMSGTFLTWLHFMERPNPVDCCVNANILALLAFCGLKSLPGYRETCRMLNRVIPGTDGSLEALASLSPYYPHPIELFFALRHAVSLGADVEEAFLFISGQPWLRDLLYRGMDDNLPVCSHQDGSIYWTSGILQTIRCFETSKERRRT